MPVLPRITVATRRPWGLRWRSSVWFVTAVVSLGITTDLLVYSIIIPVIPFQLQRLQYKSVSALTGWLLCAYSAGLVLSTIPIAVYSEKSSSRRIPLTIGLIALIISQILMMLAPNYALMAVARVSQGISSSMIWVVGLALLCDTTPEHKVGRQLGIAMTGLPVGLLVGSPVGGALYSRFGFHGPFIFGSICAALDLLARLLVIERHEAIAWGVDPWAVYHPPAGSASAACLVTDVQRPPTSMPSDSVLTVTTAISDQTNVLELGLITPESPRRRSLAGMLQDSEAALVRKPSSLLSVITDLLRSPRALTALFMSLVYGVVNSMEEPTLPLHLQAVWGLDSSQVGLVYLAAFIPALISSPIAGWLADRIGTDYITVLCLAFTAPWWLVLTLRKSLALFITSLAIQSFFVGGVVPPVTSELAAVSRNMEGVGYAHVYGAFNLAFGIGTAVGPVIGGQIYDHVRRGWVAICVITVALIMMCIILAFCYTGPDPLLSKVFRPHVASNDQETSPPKKQTLEPPARE
ncbi:MFS general substrate transporter [Pisolithus orientalis]|uniref:MFS general substrate transporter n=1 Tax=Pisolithus orientalis TaxID=936130 RepID=UPI002224C032|nr:MFS general substrate transporter [Pisolithus orientalis]KAI6005059.1 MFS general substrate transporter [Pisolithus orientalis]